MKKKLIKFLLLGCMIIGMTTTVYAAESDEVVQTEDVQEGETEAVPEETAQLETPQVTLKQTVKGVKLTWKSVEGAEKYYIYRKTGSEEWGTEPFYTTKNCSYTNTSVKYGVAYTYKVQAIGTDGETVVESEFSEDKLCTVGVVKPEDVAVARNTYTSLKVTWTKNNPATGYEIYRATSKNGTYKKVKTITKASTTSYVDKGLTLGKTYYYKVKAVYNTKKSSYSAVASGKVALVPPVMKTTSYVTSSSIQVRWEASEGAQGYYVYRKTAGGSWKKIATVKGADTTSYKDTTAKQGYYYAVQSYRTVSGVTYNSNRSYSVYAKVLATPTLKLKQVDGAKKVTLSWGSVANATSYRIYKKTGSSGSWTFVKSVSSDKLSYTATIPTKKSIYWKVRAVYAENGKYSYGAYSTAKSVYIYLPEAYASVSEDTPWPSADKTEDLMFAIVNIGKGKMRIYSEGAYLYDSDIDEDENGETKDYSRKLYLADYETGEPIDYMDIPIVSGAVDEDEIVVPYFVVDGKVTRFTGDSEIQFVFRYDGLYYKAYLSENRFVYEEIDKP